jgi:hypothetical protein
MDTKNIVTGPGVTKSYSLFVTDCNMTSRDTVEARRYGDAEKVCELSVPFSGLQRREAE